jgi:hypothetical protein
MERRAWTEAETGAARVRRAGWVGPPLVIDSHFGSEAEAVTWCRKMARVLAEDLDDSD